MELLNIKQAAHRLNLHPETIRAKARAKEISAHRKNSRWYFFYEELVSWIKNSNNAVEQEAAHDERSLSCPVNNLFVSTNAKAAEAGTTRSQRPTNSAYASLLKLKTNNTLYFLRWLDNHLGHLKIHEIDRTVIRQIRDAKASEGVKPRTINAYLQQVRIILRAATSRDWLDKTPDIRLLPEPKRRERWLTEEEKERLFNELPEHLVPIVRFALATGLRMSNVTQLKWAQIDLPRGSAWIYADQAKSNKPIGIPLNKEAMDVLLAVINKHPEYVFTYKDKPIKRANQHAWQNARKRAGLEDFRFHDMRHTWATNHTMAGTPLHQLKEMGGWSDLEMVQKYAHMNVEHLRQFAENSMSFDTSVIPSDRK